MRNEMCKCGHKKSDHIYEEGACRPGSACDCQKFEQVTENSKSFLEIQGAGFKKIVIVCFQRKNLE